MPGPSCSSRVFSSAESSGISFSHVPGIDNRMIKMYNNIRYNNNTHTGEKMSEKIRIHYIRPVTKLEKISKGDWIDLRAGKEVSLKKGDFALVPLGVSIKIPEGYEALLAPRSSTFKHYGVIQANSIGVIDESYSGTDDEWMMAVYATRDTVIPFDDRIAQFRIIKHQPEVEFEEAEKLDDESRGGFGSTGRA